MRMIVLGVSLAAAWLAAGSIRRSSRTTDSRSVGTFEIVNGLQVPFRMGHMAPFRTETGQSTAFEGLDVKQAHFTFASSR